jgi:hypothetical protein
MCSPIRRVLKGRVGEPEDHIVTMFFVMCTRLSSLGQMFSTVSASNNQTSRSGGAQLQQDAPHPTAGHHPLHNRITREATEGMRRKNN